LPQFQGLEYALFYPEDGVSKFVNIQRLSCLQQLGTRLNGPGIQSRLGARFSAPVQTGPGAYPASCTMGTGSFPEVNSGRGVTLNTHLLLVPWSRKSRSIPLLPLCDAHLANYTLYNRFLHNMICYHNTLFTKTN